MGHVAEGDRKKATEVIPDELVDEFVVWGSADRIRAGVDRYVRDGCHHSDAARDDE